MISPLPELDSAVGVYAKTDGNYGIEIVVINFAGNLSIAFLLNY